MKKTMNMLIMLILISVFYSCSSTQSSKSKDYELVIVHTNDVHARAISSDKELGYANIESVINDLKQDPKNKEVIFLDAGDTLHGTPFANLEKGESIAKILDKMNLKAMTLGNHDFNYGQERLKQIDSQFKFDIIASNVVYKDSGKSFTKKYIIEEVDGVKVGIFGLSTPETLYKANTGHVKGLVFKDPILTSQEIVKELKSQDVKFIILLSHLGLDASTEERYRSSSIAKNVDGIDLIIDGHSHTKLSEKILVNKSSIVQTEKYSENIGVVKVDFDDNSIETKLLSNQDFSNNVNMSSSKEKETELSRYIAQIKSEQNKITSKVIGSTPVKLVGDREIVRASQTNLSNLIADSMVWKTKADMAITIGGGIRASINPGPITVGDILTVLPFGDYIVTKEVTGKMIKDALEHGFRETPNLLGGYSQVGGITLDLDITKPQGERVSNIKFKNGKRFDLNKNYIVAMNEFIATGGDDYTQFINAKNIAVYDELDKVLTEYFKTLKKFPEKEDGRVRVFTH